VILVTIFFVPQLAFATDLKARVLECATTEDGIKRFSCYQDIGTVFKVEENIKYPINVRFTRQSYNNVISNNFSENEVVLIS